ncbi:phage head-tail connector protein [Neobacillus thermocopriae]|uniref:phage head-tail connector protein n=1 Tax=Neobacillus thermocopriae TaxID=1215031 RepID=UPI002E242706|nr:phage head-tail connector protein [Neobacillus thermocopriae]MED3714379.1 phage head-tail connector protein [Neobacillus thermocopriae]
MAINIRVMVRIPEIKPDLLQELVQTATDRINLRLGVSEFPNELESIAVEVVCAMYNRKYHAGIKSENADTFSVSFVDDLLKEYEPDFTRYLEMKEKQENANRGVLRFL